MDVSRVTRSKNAAKDSYNRLSRLYDLFASPFEKKFIDAGLQLKLLFPVKVKNCPI